MKKPWNIAFQGFHMTNKRGQMADPIHRLLPSGLYRWPRTLTGSAAYSRVAGFRISCGYRQWGISPRPETDSP